MDKYLEKLQALTNAQAFLVGLILAGLYYFTLYDDGSSLVRQISNAKASIVAKTAELKETEEKLKNGKRFKEDVARLSSQFKEALEFLPEELNVADILRKISTQARASGVNVVRIEPKEGRNQKDSYEEIFFDIELQGRFSELTDFLANLSKIPRIFNVRNFQMKSNDPDAQTPILTFQAEIISYRYFETSTEVAK